MPLMRLPSSPQTPGSSTENLPSLSFLFSKESLKILGHKLSLIQNTSRFYEQLRDIHDDLQKLSNRMNDAMKEEQVR